MLRSFVVGTARQGRGMEAKDRWQSNDPEQSLLARIDGTRKATYSCLHDVGLCDQLSLAQYVARRDLPRQQGQTDRRTDGQMDGRMAQVLYLGPRSCTGEQTRSSADSSEDDAGRQPKRERRYGWGAE